MDGGAWQAAIYGVAKSRTRLSDFTFAFHFHALEKEMATHSSTLAWRIPWRQEPGRLLVHGVAKSRTRLGDFTSTFFQKSTIILPGDACSSRPAETFRKMRA